MVHAENADAIEWARDATYARGVTGPEGHQLSRPAVFEDQGTNRALTLAGLVSTPLYIVHVMSSGAARLIAAARKEGQPVYGETVLSAFAADPFGLWRKNWTEVSVGVDLGTPFCVLVPTCCLSPIAQHSSHPPTHPQAAAHMMSPPIRSPSHQRGILAALKDGGLSGVGTDHCMWSSAQKEIGGRTDFRVVPNGVNGVQERVIASYDALVVKGGASLSKWVDVVATAPARVFGLKQKGALTPGADADVVLIDPRLTTTVSAATHASAGDINIYEGREFSGRIVGVWLRGRRVVDATGAVSAVRGAGTRLRLRPFGSSLWEWVPGWEADEGRWADEFLLGRGPVDRSGGGWWGRLFGRGDEL